MTYCVKCGNTLDPQAAFCPQCGNRVEASVVSPSNETLGQRTSSDASKITAPAPTSEPVSAVPPTSVSSPAKPTASKDGSARGSQIAIGVLDVVLAILLFLPWVNINVYFWGGSFSIPRLLAEGANLLRTISTFGGVPSEVQGYVGVVVVFAIALLVAWIFALVLLIRDAYRFLSGKGSKERTGSSFILFFSIAVIVLLFIAGQAISSSSGSAGLPAEVVSASPWVWAALIGSIVCLIIPTNQKASA